MRSKIGVSALEIVGTCWRMTVVLSQIPVVCVLMLQVTEQLRDQRVGYLL